MCDLESIITLMSSVCPLEPGGCERESNYQIVCLFVNNQFRANGAVGMMGI